MKRKRGPWLTLLLRLPVWLLAWLHRHGLSGLAGQRFLPLATVGRRTGSRRSHVMPLK
uniref:hypothetical protein n=1 Tax=Herbidospora sakaeratensis TaxID=564415 RepID=UPI000B26E35B|nr:hypothetical protein [Herbidospora sakaeratensis]